MITPEQIEALKKNEKPLGELDKELQDALLSVDPTDLEAHPAQEWSKITNSAYRPQDYTIHRLRPDYQPESEIVEIRIYDEGNERYFEDEGEPVGMRKAVNSKDFIGFKFEDGKIEDSPVRYADKRGIRRYEVTLDQIISGDVKVLHAIAVLFEVAK